MGFVVFWGFRSFFGFGSRKRGLFWAQQERSKFWDFGAILARGAMGLFWRFFEKGQKRPKSSIFAEKCQKRRFFDVFWSFWMFWADVNFYRAFVICLDLKTLILRSLNQLLLIFIIFGLQYYFNCVRKVCERAVIIGSFCGPHKGCSFMIKDSIRILRL